MVMFWHLCLTGVATVGRANSVMNACFTPDASTGPAATPGSASVRETGVACCAIKVWKSLISSPPTQKHWLSSCTSPQATVA